jgi:site-specific DNA recombinase
MIAAIYARKSTEQNGMAEEARSVARQVERARAYAAAKGWAIAEEHVYVADGISGAEFARRPGFLRLMNALKPRATFQALIMSEESRLGRESIETAYALKQLVTGGVRVFFYLEDRERTLDSPTDKIMLSLTAFADELERERARQRTYDAMQRKAKAGHVTGGRVFGYDNVEIVAADGRRSHVMRRVNEAEAAVVRRIFELCARGVGLNSIAKMLNEERVATPRAQQGRPHGWAPSSVRGVLYRELYRGEVVWNATRKRDTWGRKRPQARAASELVRVAAPELRLVDEATWQAVHARLASARDAYLRGTDGRLWGRPVAGVDSKYLLPGLARCALCNGGMIARSRSHGKRRVQFYGCSSYHLRGTSVCTNRLEVPMEDVDRAVLAAFERQLLAPDMVEEILAEAVAQLAPGVEQAETDRDALAAALVRVDDEIANLTNAVAAGGQLSALVKGLQTREAERERLIRRLAGLAHATVQGAAAPTRLHAQFAAKLADWRGALHRQAPIARQMLKKLLDGALRFTPREGYYEFEGVGSLAKMLAGETHPFSVASPAGFEPAFWP